MESPVPTETKKVSAVKDIEVTLHLATQLLGTVHVCIDNY
jgi:hypothetical protein